jgi:hypothetical protein
MAETLALLQRVKGGLSSDLGEASRATIRDFVSVHEKARELRKSFEGNEHIRNLVNLPAEEKFDDVREDEAPVGGWGYSVCAGIDSLGLSPVSAVSLLPHASQRKSSVFLLISALMTVPRWRSRWLAAIFQAVGGFRTTLSLMDIFPVGWQRPVSEDLERLGLLQLSTVLTSSLPHPSKMTSSLFLLTGTLLMAASRRRPWLAALLRATGIFSTTLTLMAQMPLEKAESMLKQFSGKGTDGLEDMQSSADRETDEPDHEDCLRDLSDGNSEELNENN